MNDVERKEAERAVEKIKEYKDRIAYEAKLAVADRPGKRFNEPPEAEQQELTEAEKVVVGVGLGAKMRCTEAEEKFPAHVLSPGDSITITSNVKPLIDAFPPVPPAVLSRRGEALFKAAGDIINGERQTTYGDSEDSFGFIAARWNQYLQGRFKAQFELAAKDVAFLMADFKMARECVQGKADNIIDAAGYLGINYDLI